MVLELFPDRSGFKSDAGIVGDGDSSKPFIPPQHYVANALFPTARQYQTVLSHTFSKHSPAVYYASATRDEYPGAWGHGFYLLYPYPWWAYGSGRQLGPTFYCNSTFTDFSVYRGHLRNMTVLNDTNIPLVGNYDIFKNGKYVGFTDYNNGTLEIKPCADLNSSELGVSDKDCESIVLNLVRGSVVSGNAQTDIQSEFTFFKLKLGQKEAVLRTVTILSTDSRLSDGGSTFIVFCAGFLIVPVAIAVFCLLSEIGPIFKGIVSFIGSALSPAKQWFCNTIKPWIYSIKKRILGNSGYYESLDETRDTYLMS